MRDEFNISYGEILLHEVHGVKAYLYSDGGLLDSCSTDYGTYWWEVAPHGQYTVETWVVSSLPESVGPIMCGDHSCGTPDTLVLGKHGDIYLYPNPFVGSATVAYTLPEEASTLLQVRDVAGMTVRTIDQGVKPPGTHSVVWNGTDDQGISLPPGPYWVVLRADDDCRYVLAMHISQTHCFLPVARLWSQYSTGM